MKPNQPPRVVFVAFDKNGMVLKAGIPGQKMNDDLVVSWESFVDRNSYDAITKEIDELRAENNQLRAYNENSMVNKRNIGDVMIENKFLRSENEKLKIKLDEVNERMLVAYMKGSMDAKEDAKKI